MSKQLLILEAVYARILFLPSIHACWGTGTSQSDLLVRLGITTSPVQNPHNSLEEGSEEQCG